MVRALMRRLYQKYDSGGHSEGRSLRARLLEAVMWIGDWGEIPDIKDDTYETFARIRQMVRGDEPLETGSTLLAEMSPEMYMVLVFRSIERLVRKMDHPSIIEEYIIGTVLHLLSHQRRMRWYRDAGGRQYSDDELVAEGKRRSGIYAMQRRGP